MGTDRTQEEQWFEDRARVGGWLAYRPTSTGRRPAQGAAWRKHPLGSSRLALSLMEQLLTERLAEELELAARSKRVSKN